ncbi:MAG: hypothetical protein ACTS3T_18805 [Almyronema sp.]
MQTAYKIVFNSLTTLTCTGLVGWSATAQAAPTLNLSTFNQSQFDTSAGIKANRGSGRVQPWVSVDLSELEDDRGSGRVNRALTTLVPNQAVEREPRSPVGYRGTGR